MFRVLTGKNISISHRTTHGFDMLRLMLIPMPYAYIYTTTLPTSTRAAHACAYAYASVVTENQIKKRTLLPLPVAFLPFEYLVSASSPSACVKSNRSRSLISWREFRIVIPKNNTHAQPHGFSRFPSHDLQNRTTTENSSIIICFMFLAVERGSVLWGAFLREAG